MAKSRYADEVIAKFKGGGKAATKAATEDAETEESPADDKPSGGSLGKQLARALRAGDGEAIEEAVRAICG